MDTEPTNVVILPVVHRQAMMGFGAALSALKQGYKVARAAWKQTGACLTLEERVDGDKIMLVFPYSSLEWDDFRILAIDLLAQDWVIVEDEYR